MQSTNTFILFVENPLAITKQKHTVIGPHSPRRKSPKEEGIWASFEVTVDGDYIVAVKESGSHLKSPPRILQQDGQSIRALGVPMEVGQLWSKISTGKTAVNDLLNAIRNSADRAAA